VALSACGGSGSHRHAPAAKVQTARVRGHFMVQIVDGTPTPPGSTYVVQQSWMIWQSTRPTRAQAQALASQYGHKSSVLVRRVTCRPTNTGWRCEYFT
jgi:hypothetical protein